MAKSAGIRAGRAYVEVGGDDTLLRKVLASVEQQVKALGRTLQRMGTGIAAAGSAALGAGFGAAAAFSTQGDAIAKMSARTGIAVEALSALKYAADLGGSSIDDVERAVAGMQSTILRADMGQKKAIVSLDALGVSAQQLKSLRPEQQFTLIGEALSRMQDPTRKAALAMRIFGESGRQLLPMFSQGAEGIAAATTEAERLGVIIAGDTARAAEELSDAWGRLMAVTNMVTLQIGAALAPVLTDIANKVAFAVKPVIEWIVANQDLVKWLAAGAAAAVAVGGSMAALGTVMVGAGAAIAAVGTGLAALVSPVGIVIGAVASLGATFVATQGQASVFQWLGETFNWFRDVAIEAFIRAQHVVMNWQLYGELSLRSFGLAVVSTALDLQHWFTVAVPAYLNWFGENWYQVFETAGSLLWNFAANVGENLIDLFDAIKSVLSGGDWTYVFTPLLDGFENTMKALPEIAMRELSITEQVMQESIDGINRKLDFETFRAEQRAKLGLDGASPAAPTAVGVAARQAFAIDRFINSIGQAERSTKLAAGGGTFSAFGLAGLSGTQANLERNTRDTVRAVEDVEDAIESLGDKLVLSA